MKTRVRNLKSVAQPIFRKLWQAIILSSASATVWAFDESRGPLADVMCPVAKWFAALVIPIATIAFLIGCASFLWGEELAGMTKKYVNIVIAVCFAFGGSAVVAWVAGKFGYMNTCYI